MQKRVCNGWRLHDSGEHTKSIAYLYGANHTGGQFAFEEMKKGNL